MQLPFPLPLSYWSQCCRARCWLDSSGQGLPSPDLTDGLSLQQPDHWPSLQARPHTHAHTHSHIHTLTTHPTHSDDRLTLTQINNHLHVHTVGNEHTYYLTAHCVYARTHSQAHTLPHKHTHTHAHAHTHAHRGRRPPVD